MNEEMKFRDWVTDTESVFPYKDLLELEYFKRYRAAYYELPKQGFQLGHRNYSHLLSYIIDLDRFNKLHSNSFAKRLNASKNDWKNFEAVFSEIIVYRFYIRLVYEGLIKNIQMVKDECDIIIELLDGTKQYLEVFCVMPYHEIPEPGKFIIEDVKTHTQEELASIRQKLLRKIEKQKQFTQPRVNFAVIELNDASIAGDFTILSSLSDGYKVNISRETGKIVSSGFDWSKSVFDDECTKHLKGIIYFNLGDYQSRTLIINGNFGVG